MNRLEIFRLEDRVLFEAAAAAEIAKSHERTISSVLKMRVSAGSSGIDGASGEETDSRAL